MAIALHRMGDAIGFVGACESATFIDAAVMLIAFVLALSDAVTVQTGGVQALSICTLEVAITCC